METASSSLTDGESSLFASDQEEPLRHRQQHKFDVESIKKSDTFRSEHDSLCMGEFNPSTWEDLATPVTRSPSSSEDDSAFGNDDPLGPPSDGGATPKNSDGRNLLIAFALMVLIGSGNKIFQKLQAVPMYNYPTFLIVFGVFVYVPLAFAYIIPVAYFGWFGNAIPREHLSLPKKPFAVMGILDCLSSIMVVFASVYLPGPLLVLLPQAAIPISMGLSRRILKQRYGTFQYVGAAVVIGGILVVLEPLLSQRHAPDHLCVAIDEEADCAVCQEEVTKDGCLSHRLDSFPRETLGFDSPVSLLGAVTATPLTSDDGEGIGLCKWVESTAESTGSASLLIWSVVMILSCVPMTLSSIYKEMALGTSLNLDPIYMNGWVALFQFCFVLVLAIPAGLTSSPPVYPQDLPRHLADGMKCYLGTSTICTGCHPDQCDNSTLFVNTYLLLNLFYNLLMMYILKFGSSNILFLALTVMVPVGNLAFALPFMPDSARLHLSDVLGLVVIMMGLVLYRFGGTLVGLARGFKQGMLRRVGFGPQEEEEEQDRALRESLLRLDECHEDKDDEGRDQ